MNIGKLYQVKKCYWYLYPSKETAARRLQYSPIAESRTETIAYLSKQFNCTYIPENSIFCLLEQEGKFLKVLLANGELGWMIYPEDEDWAKGLIEEVTE